MGNKVNDPYSIFMLKVDLLSIKGASVQDISNGGNTEKGIFIPINGSDLFISTNRDGIISKAYLNMVAFKSKYVSKYGDTHVVKQTINKKKREDMSKEDILSTPIIGSIRSFSVENKTSKKDNPSPKKEKSNKNINDFLDDLPF